MFADVSASCNLGTRHDRLTPSFLHLLNDDSRWVSMSVCLSVLVIILDVCMYEYLSSYAPGMIQSINTAVHTYMYMCTAVF